MRETVGVFRVQPDFVQQFVDALSASRLFLIQSVDVQRFADDLADGHARVKRRGRILEDDLHLAAVRQHVDRDLLLGVVDGRAVEDDAAGRRFVQADGRAAERRLAAAGFADQAERLALVDKVIDRFHSLDVLLLAEARLDREVFL